MTIVPTVLALLTAAVPAGTGAGGGTLTVRVDNVRVGKGHVRLDVCPRAAFLKDDCPYSASAPATRGSTVVTVANLPPGRYAVQAYLDENDDGRVNRALLGIPREGVGFSNGVRIRFSAPRFDDAAFAFSGTAQAIRVSLQYFL